MTLLVNYVADGLKGLTLVTADAYSLPVGAVSAVALTFPELVAAPGTYQATIAAIGGTNQLQPGTIYQLMISAGGFPDVGWISVPAMATGTINVYGSLA